MSISSVDRRSFLFSASLVCFAGMTSAAFAQLRANAMLSGKPLLTAASLNAIIPAPTDPRHSSVLLEAASDPLTFVRSRFTLSPTQQAEIASISATDLSRLRQNLRNAATQNLPITVSIIPSGQSTSSPSQQCIMWDSKGLCVMYGNTYSPGPVAPTLVPLHPVSNVPLSPSAAPAMRPPNH